MKLRNAIALVMVMLILAALTACAPAETTEQTSPPQQTEETGDNRPDTDRSGNPITLPDQVDSIISMAPSATQTLLDLGLRDKLIAVDTYSAMYFDLEDLPTFDMMEPDTEQMAVLDADLIFTTGMSASAGADPFKPLRQHSLAHLLSGFVSYYARKRGARAKGVKAFDLLRRAAETVEDDV